MQGRDVLIRGWIQCEVAIRSCLVPKFAPIYSGRVGSIYVDCNLSKKNRRLYEGGRRVEGPLFIGSFACLVGHVALVDLVQVCAVHKLELKRDDAIERAKPIFEGGRWESPSRSTTS